jgi:divalent metal cation (Fe/Co/Zn/Cd) transporter
MEGETTLTKAHAKITEIEHCLKERYGQKTHVIIHMEPVE